MAATSSSSAASTRPFAAKTSAQQVRQNASSVTWSYLPYERLENLAPLLRSVGVTGPLAREHQGAADVGERLEAWRARRLSPRPSPRPDGRAPGRRSRARPRRIRAGRARAARGRCRPPAARRRAREPPGATTPRRLGSARSAPGRAILARRRRDVAKQPLGASEPTARRRVVPNASAYSRESQSAIRAARASSPSRRKPAYARSRATTASRSSRSHQRARPRPSSASGDSPRSRACVNASRGAWPVAARQCLVASGEAVLRRDGRSVIEPEYGPLAGHIQHRVGHAISSGSARRSRPTSR